MFGFLRRDKNKTPTESAPKAETGLIASLRSRLGKTRQNLTAGLADLLLGKKTIDAELLEEIETRPPHQRSIGENPQVFAALIDSCAHRCWIWTTPLTGPGDLRSRIRPVVSVQPIRRPRY